MTLAQSIMEIIEAKFELYSLSICNIWDPLVYALRNQFTEPSKEMIDTILVAQNQVKDGFLAAGQW